MNNIQEVLIKKELLYFTKGDESNIPILKSSKKFSAILGKLYKAYPDQIITEDMIRKYIQKF